MRSVFSDKFFVFSLSIVLIISTGILFYGFKFDSMYGVIDSNFEELSDSSPLKFLYYWDETRGAGELQSLRFPELIQSTYIYLIKSVFEDYHYSGFAKLFFINLLLPVSTLFCLYSFTFSQNVERHRERYFALVLLSLLSILNPAFLQSGMNTLIFQKFDYILFCFAIFALNSIAYRSRGYIFSVFLLVISFGAWHQFPYWLPYLAILIVYVSYLLYTKGLSAKKTAYILLLYFFISLPSLFSIIFYLVSIDLSSSNQGAYTQEVFLYANSQSNLLNTLSFIAGTNWGRVWFWTGEQFYRYFDILSNNSFFVLIRYVPISIFLISIYLISKSKELLGYLLSALIVIYYFVIPANSGPLGWLYSLGFQHSILFQIYRESHNKFIFPTIALISIVVFISVRNRSKLNTVILSLLSVYLASFVYIVSVFSVYSQDGFFKLPPEYKKISDHIDSHSTVMVLPQYSTIQTFKYGHFGVNPIEYVIKNPTLIIYHILQSRFNNAFLDFVLNDFNLKRGYGPSARGSKEAQFNEDTIINTNINYIVLDGNISGIPDINSDEFENLKNKISRLSQFRFKAKEGEILVYERKQEFRRSVFLTKHAEYQKISPTKYVVRLNKVEDMASIIFLQSFDRGWKVYPIRFREDWTCGVIEKFYEDEVKECHPLGGHKTLDASSYISNGDFVGSHLVYDGYANHWTMNMNEFIQNYPTSYYRKNPDGTIDVDLVLYYRPQMYLYIVFCLSLIGITFVTWWYFCSKKNHA